MCLHKRGLTLLLNKRRTLLKIAAAGMAGAAMPRALRAACPRVRALAFDAFPIFDPRPVFALCEKHFPGKGSALADAWRVRQFDYQWLRALSGHYADFWRTSEDALVFASRLLSLTLHDEARVEIMNGYLNMPVWPDVPKGLTELRAAGIRLSFVSNATDVILQAGLRNAGLGDAFEHVLSTDRIKTYKPDPRAYRMAMEALRLPREEIGFVAFAGWDAAGAKAFGYPTYWVNRLKLPPEELGVRADGVGDNLSGLLGFLKG